MSPVNSGERGGPPKGKRFITACLGRQGEHPAAVVAPNRREVPEDEILNLLGFTVGSKASFDPEVFVVPTLPGSSLPGSSEPLAESTPDPALAWLADLCGADSSSGQEAGILPVLLPALRARGARVAVVALLAIALIAAVALLVVGLLAFFHGNAGSLSSLMQKMAEVLESSRSRLPE